MKKYILLIPLALVFLFAAAPYANAGFLRFLGGRIHFQGGRIVIGTPAPTTLVDKVEYGTITLSGVSSNTATLSSSFDTSRSSLIYLGTSYNSTDSQADRNNASIYFTNGTTITAVRGGSTNTIVVSFAAVQWAAGVTNSIQRSEVIMAPGSNSGTKAITAVDTSRALVHTNGAWATTTTTFYTYYEGRKSLTNSTTVTSTRVTTADHATTTFEVIEFAPGIVDSVQEKTFTIGSGASSATASLTAVTLDDSALFLGGYAGSSGTITSNFGRVAFTDSTTLTSNRPGSSGTLPVTVTVVDFNSSLLNSSTQNKFIGINSTAAATTTTITSVVPTKTFLTWLGEYGNSPSPVNSRNRITLTDATAVTMTRAGTNGNLVETNFSVVESK